MEKDRLELSILYCKYNRLPIILYPLFIYIIYNLPDKKRQAEM